MLLFFYACSVLFCPVLSCSVLFCLVLSYSVLSCSVLQHTCCSPISSLVPSPPPFPLSSSFLPLSSSLLFPSLMPFSPYPSLLLFPPFPLACALYIYNVYNTQAPFLTPFSVQKRHFFQKKFVNRLVGLKICSTFASANEKQRVLRMSPYLLRLKKEFFERFT